MTNVIMIAAAVVAIAGTAAAASLIGTGVILVLLEIDYRLRRHR